MLPKLHGNIGLKVEGANENNRWSKSTDDSVALFIKGIVTAEGKDGIPTELLRAMISGIPSPWARVLMTRKALAVKPEDLNMTVLDECYKMFRSEWRGLVAAYALRPDSFEFSKAIPLCGRSLADNYGEMSVLNMYGDMLFDETPLWALKNEKVNKDDIKANPPCIQILYYKIKSDTGFNRIAVGATSPYTLLFSSVNYRLPDSQKLDIPWIINGKFVDPTSMSPDKFRVEDAQRLHSFIHNMSSRMQNDMSGDRNPAYFYDDYFEKFFAEGFASDFGVIRDDMMKIINDWNTELTTWKEELAIRIVKEGRMTNTSIPVAVAIPEGPLAMLMSNERTFWYDSNKLYSEKKDGPSIKSTEILLDSEYIAVWRGTDDASRDYSKSSAFYIKAEGKGLEYWLPLPFTKEAIKVFEADIAGIVAGNGAIFLTAEVGEEGKVQVDFKAKLDGSEEAMSICRKTYQMEVIPESDGKVFVWPDFKSSQWNKYFYYSEFPMNVTGVRMIPNFEGVEESQLAALRLVTYPVNKVGASMHKYEILSSSTPLTAIDIRIDKGGREVSAGTLILKVQSGDTNFGESEYLKNYLNLNLNPATVGVDFGSTNTCVYYRPDGGSVAPMPFKNRRLALVGFDNPTLSLAQKDELLFISNEGTMVENGQVKSWLHEHDTLYVTKDGNAEGENNLDKEVEGGIPVNERNIPIVSMDEHVIITNAGRLNYNMKWLSSDETKLRKTAFMSTLWLQICADLVECGLKPVKLNWSYPSAMSKSDYNALRDIYRGLAYPYESTTMLSADSHTEAESVCAYSMYKGSKVNDSTLSLGIDVGGSTSDILVVKADGGNDALITQSSIRLAGGFFFKAINSSAKFRRALYNFHESKRTGVKVLNIEDVVNSAEQVYKRSPYYLNNIFDQLFNETDFRKFYGYLHDSAAPVFALPAYVTGVLMFYSGMLVRNAIEKDQLTSVKNIAMRYYGKGGRLFEWLLKKYWEDAVEYYAKCFAAGAGTDELKLDILNYSNDSGETIDMKENKSEVAIGLVSDCFNQIQGVGTGADSIYDVIGEKGFKYAKAGETRPLDAFDVIPDDIFDGGINLKFPERMENFSAFLDIFIKFVEIDSGGILKDMKALKEGIENLNIRSFIQNDPEYQKYLAEKKKQSSASYKMPIIIAAALSYLNNTLLPAVANQLK